MDADTAMKATSGSGASSGTGTTSSEFICFNPAPDTQPGFLEHESLMLEVLNWIEQAMYYIKSGFKNNPLAVGSHIHLAPLINPTWLQSI